MDKKISIIFDTDMDTDCDDAGAFAMLLEAHRSHKVQLLGVVADSISPYAAPCCEMMARFYGVNLPVGTTFSYCYPQTTEDNERFADYIRHSQTCLSAGRSYNYSFAKEINKKDSDYPSATSVYRKLLAGVEDNSVTVLCVGMLTAVACALASGPDDISPLHGVELFRKKVKHIITMGIPRKVNDFNWGKDAIGASRFFSICPVPVYISAEGTEVLTGSHLSYALPEKHPLRLAYEIWLGGQNLSRSSWDLIAALYAMQPDTTYLREVDLGNGWYDATKRQFYVENSGGKNIKEIFLNCEPEIMEKILNKCMLGDFEDIEIGAMSHKK